MTILLPLLIALAGLVVYLAVPGKAAELGKISFGAGLLVALLQAGSHAVKVW